MSQNKTHVTDEEALALHASGRPGKLEIVATKPLVTQRDLALAYTPGVAVPCLRIQKDPDLSYDYTAKGNIVAIISNGTAVLVAQYSSRRRGFYRAPVPASSGVDTHAHRRH